VTRLTVPQGPTLVLERNKVHPFTVTLRTSRRGRLDLTDKTVVLRIGRPGAPALYQEALVVPYPTSGAGSLAVKADIPPARDLSYHFELLPDERILLEGPAEVDAVIGAAAP